MLFLAINKERLMYHQSAEGRHAAGASLNWWVQEVGVGQKQLNFLLHIKGVHYIYRQIYEDKDEIQDFVINNMLNKNSEIQGIVVPTETSLVLAEPAEVVTGEITTSDFMGVSEDGKW